MPLTSKNCTQWRCPTDRRQNTCARKVPRGKNQVEEQKWGLRGRSAALLHTIKTVNMAMKTVMSGSMTDPGRPPEVQVIQQCSGEYCGTRPLTELHTLGCPLTSSHAHLTTSQALRVRKREEGKARTGLQLDSAVPDLCQADLPGSGDTGKPHPNDCSLRFRARHTQTYLHVHH